MKLKKYLYISNFIDKFYDCIYNVRTCKTNTLANTRKAHYIYGPSNYQEIKNIFKQYPFSKKDHLIDYGCGLGRVMIIAALYSCKNITGIEINKDIYDNAAKNIKSFQKRFKKLRVRFHLHHIDASDYVIDDDINKFFFYDPFHLKIFIKLIYSIEQSLARNDRTITLFFYRPEKSWIAFLNSTCIFKNINTVYNKTYYYDPFCHGCIVSVYSNHSMK